MPVCVNQSRCASAFRFMSLYVLIWCYMSLYVLIWCYMSLYLTCPYMSLYVLLRSFICPDISWYVLICHTGDHRSWELVSSRAKQAQICGLSGIIPYMSSFVLICPDMSLYVLICPYMSLYWFRHARSRRKSVAYQVLFLICVRECCLLVLLQ